MNNRRIALLRAEDDNVFVAWCRFAPVTHDTFMHIFVQKVDSAGNSLWPAPVQVDTGNLLLVFSNTGPQLVNDGNVGVFVLWEALLPSDKRTHFVQHLDAGGAVQWPPNGIEVSTQYENSHKEADLCYLPSVPALFVFWQEHYVDPQGYAYTGLYGQRISLTGARLWSDSGKVFGPLDLDTTCINIVVKKGQGDDVAVFYLKDFFVGTSLQSNVVAMRLDRNGAYLWPQEKVTLSSASGEKQYLAVSDFARNQWVAVWSDLRNVPQDAGDIYAQNVKYDGSLGPGIEEAPQRVPFADLLVSSPNRATGRFAITYVVPGRSPVVLAVYDLSGALIRTLARGVRNPGSYTVNWEARSRPAGVYLIRLTAGDFDGTKKLVLMR